MLRLKESMPRGSARPDAQNQSASVCARRFEADLHIHCERSGDPARALNYIQRIRHSFKALQTFPESGRLRNDLRSGLRIFGFERRVVISYLILDNGDVEIGRLFYGGQDYDTLLSDPDEP